MGLAAEQMTGSAEMVTTGDGGGTVSLPVSEAAGGVPMPGPAARAPRPGPRQVAKAAVVAAVLAAATGVLAGMVWRLVAPHIEIIRVDQGFVYADAEPEQAVAADGWFALLGLAAGLIAASLVWVALRRHRGMLVLLGLVVGSLAGAWLGWWFGIKIEEDHFRALASTAAIGTHLPAPLSLRMSSITDDQPWRVNGVLVVQALAAAALYTILAGFSADADLHPGRVPQPDPALAGTGLDGHELGTGTWAGSWSATAPAEQPPPPAASAWPEVSSGPAGPAGPTG